MSDIIFILAGLAMLIAAGEATLRGAVGLSRRLGLSPAVIGLTVVGFGTSMPELVVSIQAALEGRPGFAVGNAVGSNIANSFLILGAAALIQPLHCEPRAMRRDGGAMVAVTLLCVLIALTGRITAWQGAMMLLMLGGFIAWSYRQDRKWADLPAALHEKEANVLTNIPASGLLIGALLTGGLAGLAGGAMMLVDGAANLAQQVGISDAVVGLTIFAFGTSLPELAAAMMAAARGHTDVAVGNVIGSNIFNILGILGAASLVAPLPFDPSIRAVDIWVLLGASLVLMPILITGWRVSRREGAVLLACYTAYIASIVWRTAYSETIAL